jgi:formyltetrahydrofolate deformylase
LSTADKAAKSRYILTLSCPDQKGIVAAVATFLLEQSCNIVDSAQFGDATKGRFFMRVCFAAEQPTTLEALQRFFGVVAERFDMQWNIYEAAAKQRVLLMVSKFGHCLNDLLYRTRIGALPIDIRAIVSNHRDFYQLAASQNIPFHYLPVTADSKGRQEERLVEIFQEEQCDLLVLARYMQILSPRLCERLRERAINIHHSFLPSFQGAKPYQQAHDRGVKLIGATAHYVTPDLDEGPIIEQEVARVDHAMSVEDCVGIGRDIECLVLSRAVKWHAEHRILLDGARTIVFK